MTTLRKKKEFKKSSKKQNNKTSKKKIRKRSKKRLLARSKLGGAGSPATVRTNRQFDDQPDILEVFKTLGTNFVETHNKKHPRKLEVNENRTEIKKDGSVYLNIDISNTGKQFFHLSLHPGSSGSGCGAIHVIQLHTLSGDSIQSSYYQNGELKEKEGRCFKIEYNTLQRDKLSLDSQNKYNQQDFKENDEFKILKNFIENISENDVGQMGLYSPLTSDNIKTHDNLQRQSAPSTPRTIDVGEPSSTNAEHGSGKIKEDVVPNIPQIKPIKLFNLFNTKEFPYLPSK